MHIQKFSLSDTNKYYSWRIVTYTDLSVYVNDIIKLSSHWAYIKHDKDNTDIHYHIIFTLKQAKSARSVLKLFPTYQNTFIEPTSKSELGGDFLYLMHANCSSKTQYFETDISCSNLDYFYSLANMKDVNKKNEELLFDICESDFDITYLVKKYGRDFMINFEKYKTFRDIYRYHTAGILPNNEKSCKLCGVEYEQPKLTLQKNRF